MNNDHEQGLNQEQEIDLVELFTKLWSNRNVIIKWACIGAVIGLIIGCSLPKEYKVSVTLAPEVTGKKGSSSLNFLASMADFSLPSSDGDAVYPKLYPDIIKSIPFLTSLFNVEVETNKDGAQMTVQQYMTEKQSSPWWNAILNLPSKLLGAIFSHSEPKDADHILDNFKLTKEESSLASSLSHRIVANYDKTSATVTVDVTMQDPLVAAILADTVVNRLQQYVTEYRTNKARQDLIYADKLNDEAREEYYAAQQAYAEYVDRNQGLATQSASITRDRLANDVQLAYSLYNQTSLQLQKAKAKVQENTPAFVTITPPTVPLQRSSPSKAKILIVMTFLAVVACSGKILFLDPMLAKRKEGATKSSK